MFFALREWFRLLPCFLRLRRQIPVRGLRRCLRVLEDNQHAHPHAQAWRDRPALYHVEHASGHLEALCRVPLDGPGEEEPHLAHASTRLLMALEQVEAGGSWHLPPCPPRV